MTQMHDWVEVYFGYIRVFLHFLFKKNYSKICLKRPLKNSQNKDLTENGSLMKVESIAECSFWDILQYL